MTDFTQLEAEKYWSFPASRRADSQPEVTKMILSGKYLGSRKIDGNYFRFVKSLDGEMFLLSRSRGVGGEFSDKIHHVPHLLPFFQALPCGTCLLGELYSASDEISSAVTKVVGGSVAHALEVQTSDESKLSYYVFDIWQWDGVSCLDITAENRFRKVSECSAAYSFPFVSWAKYYCGEALMEKLGDILSSGGEGIVMTLADSIPSPGKRTARKTLKVKREICNTLDVVILGTNPPRREYSGNLPDAWPYWENGTAVTRSYALGFPGSFKIGALKDGEVVQIGSLPNLSDDILSCADSYVGSVAEISCMQVLETGGLRHPRFIQFRPDLSPSDCEYSKIFG
jgi:hypothetical protein